MYEHVIDVKVIDYWMSDGALYGIGRDLLGGNVVRETYRGRTLRRRQFETMGAARAAYGEKAPLDDANYDRVADVANMRQLLDRLSPA